MKFGDIIDGVTMQEKRDKVTGKISRVIVESRDMEIRPRISIKDRRRKTASLSGQRSRAKARYHLPIGAIIMVNEGDRCGRRDGLGENSERDHKDKGYHRRACRGSPSSLK